MSAILKTEEALAARLTSTLKANARTSNVERTPRAPLILGGEIEFPPLFCDTRSVIYRGPGTTFFDYVRVRIMNNRFYLFHNMDCWLNPKHRHIVSLTYMC